MREFVYFAGICLVAIAVLSPLTGGTPALAGPRIVVSIKPIHSLAAAIMEGVAGPKLLLDGAASPHSYALKPSDATALNEADAIVLVSRNLEVFLDSAIASLPANAHVIELERTPGLRLLPVREGGLHGAAGEEDEEHEGHHHGGSFDVHFWLDPLNAIAIARHLQHEFSAIDPSHAAQYQANAAKLEAALYALDADLKAVLAGLKDKPFIVFHDVTQYFETRYGLNSAGSITLSPERQDRAIGSHLRFLGARVPAQARADPNPGHKGEARCPGRGRCGDPRRAGSVFRAHARGCGKPRRLP